MKKAVITMLLAMSWCFGVGSAPLAQADTIQLGAMQGGLIRFLSVPILETAYSRAGVDMNVQFMPGPRELAALKSRDIDGVSGRIGALAQQFPGMVRVEPAILSLKVKVYVRAESAMQIETAEDLEPYVVVIHRGSIVSGKASRFARETISVKDYDQMLHMLVAGRVDALVASEVATEIGLARTGMRQKVRALDVTLADEPLYHFLYDSFADEAALVAAELSKMQKSGELKAISDAGWDEMLAKVAKEGF